MLFAVFASAILLCSQVSWAFPQQTAFTNATRTSSISQTTPTCSPNCVLGCFMYPFWKWGPGQVVTTITAATVVLVVNNRTNATRTTTVLNTDLGGFDLPETNSAGTKVTTMIQSDYLAKTNITTVITFPTAYYDYPYSFSWSGVLPSTTNGHTTCITNQGTEELLPSHPVWDGTYYLHYKNQSLSDIPPSPDSVYDDMTGLTYVLDAYEGYSEDLLEALFPDVGAVSVCSTDSIPCAAPATALQTAHFLTETSTSHEAGDDVQTTSSSLGKLSPSVSATPTEDVQVKSSEISVSFATQSWSSPSVSVVSNPPALLLSSTVDLSRANQPQPSLPPSPARSSPSQPGISPSSLSSMNQDVASPPTPSFAPPAPLSTKAPPPSTPLSSSAAWISSLTQPTQPVIAGLTNFGVNVVNTPTENPRTTTGLPAVAVGSQTRLVGSDISVTTITSRSSTSLVAGTTTLPLPSPSVVATPPPIVVGSNTVIADSASRYIISGTTLLPGSTITIGTGTLATVIALQTSNSETQIIIGTSTSLLAKTSTTEPNIGLPSFTIGTQTITANSLSQYIANGQTLAPGSPLTLGTGTLATVIALQTSNSETQIIIGTSTSLLAKPSTVEPNIELPSFTIGMQTITANSLSQYIVNGQTLAPGSPLTLGTGSSTTIVALQTSNSQTELIIGTSTSVIVAPAKPPLTSILVPGPITIGTQTVTPNSVSQYLIASQTLVPGGPAITVSGTPVSLAPGATAVVVGTSTSGLGGYIWSGIGGESATKTTSGPAVFTGGAEAMMCGRAWGLGLGVFCGVLAIL